MKIASVIFFAANNLPFVPIHDLLKKVKIKNFVSFFCF